jgi:hypothetical protein
VGFGVWVSPPLSRTRYSPPASPAPHWVSNVRLRVYGSGFGVQGSTFRVWGLGFEVQGLVFRVQGSGLRVQGFAFWVQSSGSRA